MGRDDGWKIFLGKNSGYAVELSCIIHNNVHGYMSFVIYIGIIVEIETGLK